MLKSRLLFKKIANFTSKVLQNYKKLEREIFRMLLKHESDHLSVLFQFAWLYLQWYILQFLFDIHCEVKKVKNKIKLITEVQKEGQTIKHILITVSREGKDMLRIWMTYFGSWMAYPTSSCFLISCNKVLITVY